MSAPQPSRRARNRVGAAVAVLTLATSLTLSVGPSPDPAGAADLDCADFSSQAEAQDFFESHDPQADPHYLDGDDDGIACEDNPCPCTGDGGGGSGSGNPGTKPDRKARARIVSVTDGDTLEVRLDGRFRDVRVIGIDTPEVYGGVECGGPEASASMRGMVDRGDRVTLIRDFSQDAVDRYGRLLRYVELGRRDLGKRQIARGWAEVYVYNDNPFKRVRGYRRAEERARDQASGVWGSCGGEF